MILHINPIRLLLLGVACGFTLGCDSEPINVKADSPVLESITVPAGFSYSISKQSEEKGYWSIALMKTGDEDVFVAAIEATHGNLGAAEKWVELNDSIERSWTETIGDDAWKIYDTGSNGGYWCILKHEHGEAVVIITLTSADDAFVREFLSGIEPVRHVARE